MVEAQLRGQIHLLEQEIASLKAKAVSTPRVERKPVEQIILEAQGSVKKQMQDKDKEIDRLNERIIQSEYKHFIATKHVDVQADIKIPSKSKSAQTTSFTVADLRTIASRDLDLAEVEQLLEEVKNELARCDGAGDSLTDDKTSINQSLRGKRSLFERIDDTQALLVLTEVSKERRILKNKEINLLREFYS